MLSILLFAAPAMAADAVITIGNQGADGEIGGGFFNQGGPWSPYPGCFTGSAEIGTEFRFALEFPLTALPADATITGATLSIRRSAGASDYQIAIYGYAGDGSISAADVDVSGTTPVLHTPTTTQHEDVDVTPLLTSDVVSAGWAGFSLRQEPLPLSQDEGNVWDCPNSSEYPILTIAYSVPDELGAQLVLAKDAAGSTEAFEIDSALGGAVQISEAAPYTIPYTFAAQESATEDLTEILSEEQMAAGWSFVDASCANATDAEWSDWTSDGATVTVTIRAGDDITCTWVNALAGASPTPTPTASPASDELPDTAAANGQENGSELPIALLAVMAIASAAWFTSTLS